MVDPYLQNLRNAVSDLTGATSVKLTQVRGGLNNQVFKVETPTSRYALKQYRCFEGDSRNRLGTEFRALNFLRDHGVACVPEPVVSDPSRNLALYEWIDGDLVVQPTDGDIISVLNFVRILYALRKERDAVDLPLASETCLSLNELIRQINGRIRRLESEALKDERLGRFIYSELAPAFAAWSHSALREYAAMKTDPDVDLAQRLRTLSPADFGFHNSRRLGADRLILLDFEYFGWDDPAKLATEFILHPGMSLSTQNKAQLLRGFCKIYDGDPTFLDRVRLLYPLYSLRWCLIVLNDFLPDRWIRHANLWRDVDRYEILDEQLGKAEALLRAANESVMSIADGN